MNMRRIRKIWIVAALFLAVVTSACTQRQVRDNYVPATISAEARKALKAIYDARAYAQVFPAADDLAGWRKTHADGEQGKVEISEKAVSNNQVTGLINTGHHAKNFRGSRQCNCVVAPVHSGDIVSGRRVDRLEIQCLVLPV